MTDQTTGEGAKTELQWVPVTERLPACDGGCASCSDTVIVADKFGNVGFGERWEDGTWDCSIEIIDGDCPGYVTHWMPLPLPPTPRSSGT